MTTPPIHNAQIGQLTDTINTALQASATQIVGVMALIVGIAVVVLVVLFLNESRNRAKRDEQQFELLKAEISANNLLARELQVQNKTLDDIAFYQSSMAGDMAENLEVNKQRAIVHDINRVTVEKILADQKLNQAETLLKFAEVVARVDVALNRNPCLPKEDVERWEQKLDLLIARLIEDNTS